MGKDLLSIKCQDVVASCVEALTSRLALKKFKKTIIEDPFPPAFPKLPHDPPSKPNSRPKTTLPTLVVQPKYDQRRIDGEEGKKRNGPAVSPFF